LEDHVAGFSLGSFFDPKDGGDIFLKMSVEFQRTKQRRIPKTNAVRTSIMFHGNLTYKLVEVKF
jgi:hypothetical protein